VKTWTELQEWVAIHAGVHARVAAVAAKQAAREQIVRSVGETLATEEFEQFNEDEIELLKSALMWKAFEEIAQYHQEQAEGWCEDYYRDLKRKFEVES